MAEGDALVMNNFKEQLLLKAIDCDSDVFKMALYWQAIADPDGAPAYSTATEITAANYTAGGSAVNGLAVTQDDTNNWAKWDATDVKWIALGSGSPRAAVLYDTTVSNLVLIQWELATNSNGGDYTLQFNTNGMLTLA